jgi:hypothetical protein
VIFWGVEYRGRGRETVWDSTATLSENSFTNIHPINRYNLDKKFEQANASQIEWQALTTGGFGGVDAMLEFADRGTLAINTKLVNVEIPVRDIGLNDLIFDAGGINRRIRVFRLPDTNACHEAILSRKIEIDPQRDNALYVCITQEDGHLIWSSPIYVIPE